MVELIDYLISLSAIIGKSGAGKTTFLQLLANLNKSGKRTGIISSKDNNNDIVFVSQIPNLPKTETVEQIITFARYATLDRYVSKIEVEQEVGLILDELDLESIRNRQIQYLSGGEKKRVSIGMQLLRNPTVLILDEPCSGLDTIAAINLLTTLRNLKNERNITIIISLHQPSLRMVKLIDYFISLKDGYIVYQGYSNNAIKNRKLLVNELNINDKQCNTLNCVDYLLETEYLIQDTNRLSIHSQSNTNIIVINSESRSESMNNNNNNNNKNKNKYFHFRKQWNAFYGLSARSFRYYINHSFFVLFNLLFNIICALSLSRAYGKMGRAQGDIQNRFGSLAFCLLFIGFQSICYAGQFFENRLVFIDEYNAKLYGSISYLLSQLIPSLILLRLLPTFLFSIIFFYGVEYQSHTLNEFIFVLLLQCLVATLCVYAISAACSNLYTSIWTSMFSNLLFLLFGGVFIQNKTTSMPYWINWIQYTSFYRFAFEILMVNEYTGLMFDINSTTAIVNGIQINTNDLDVDLTGQFFLTFFGMQPSMLNVDYLALCAWIISYFIIAAVSLRYLNKSVR